MHKSIIIYLANITVKVHYLFLCLSITTSGLIVFIYTKIDLNHYGTYPKRFRSSDRKHILSVSLGLRKLVFVRALLNITQPIDVSKERNILLCNFCYLSLYQKMSASIDNAIALMDVGDTGYTHFCEVNVQIDSILVSNCSIQCDDSNR